MNIQEVTEYYRVSVDRLQGLYDLGFTKAEIHALVAPPRTLGRRKNKLSLEESDRVQRLERIMAHAMQVFKNKEKSIEWLRRKNRAMDGRYPIEMLGSETGAQEAHDVLGRLQFGMYS